MRLAMKFGVSLAATTPLPSRRAANDETSATISGSVSGVGISSSSFM